MSAKLASNFELNESSEILQDKLPIIINGSEKYASGLTKRTTIDDVKYAMLSVAEPSFKIENLNDYGIFEKWQGNERILDGKIKIYKLIRLWKSLPGDQLSQVKFMIKKRKLQSTKLAQRDSNVIEQPTVKQQSNNKFAFCTFSPALEKTWNFEKAKRKSSLVKRQLNLAANGQQENTLLSQFSSSESECEYSRESSIDTSSSEFNLVKNSDRYASIKRFNRSRKSTVKQTQQIKKSFIDLVTKQNEIIDKQLDNINNQRSRSKSLTKFFRSKSLDKCDKSKKIKFQQEQTELQQQQQQLDINDNDIKATFCLDDKQTKEYSKLCKDYFKLQQSLNTKLQRIEDLKQELSQYDQFDDPESSSKSLRLTKSILKTNKKLQSSIDTTNFQSNKLNDLNGALNKIDDIILLKEKFIQSLEKELQRLDSSSKLNTNEPESQPENKRKSLAFTSESASSSTSSVLTSVSQQQPQAHNNYCKSNKMIIANKYNSSYSGMPGDNESDTGISSANSDDFNTQLETLV